MRVMPLDHMTDHAPKLKARLWRAKDRDAFLDERIGAAQEVLRGNLELLDRPDPAGEAMARARWRSRNCSTTRKRSTRGSCKPMPAACWNRRRAQHQRQRRKAVVEEEWDTPQFIPATTLCIWSCVS